MRGAVDMMTGGSYFLSIRKVDCISSVSVATKHSICNADQALELRIAPMRLNLAKLFPILAFFSFNMMMRTISSFRVGRLSSSPKIMSESLTMSTKTTTSTPVTAKLIRSLSLSDPDGKKRVIGEVMGNGKSVVIFLRHLA
jgi:hypothetical protein